MHGMEAKTAKSISRGSPPFLLHRRIERKKQERENVRMGGGRVRSLFLLPKWVELGGGGRGVDIDRHIS